MTEAADAQLLEEVEAVKTRKRDWGNTWMGGAVLGGMFLACVLSLGWTVDLYDGQDLTRVLEAPGAGIENWMGRDRLGRSLLVRSLLGGSISLGIGLAAAAISVFIGTGWGLIAGYAGGRVDAVMMRIVDVLYSLPYILLVVLLAVAFEPMLIEFLGWLGGGGWLTKNASLVGNVVTLFVAIGSVSWLTLARVVRGQVLSLKGQPFVEAARAMGCGPTWIILRHVLPNLLGPVIVYTTLTVPQAVLQESFLSFLGIGVQAPLPSWGNLAAEGLTELNPVKSYWWLLIWPSALLGLTLLSLNFMGDGLRDAFDPKTQKR